MSAARGIVCARTVLKRSGVAVGISEFTIGHPICTVSLLFTRRWEGRCRQGIARAAASACLAGVPGGCRARQLDDLQRRFRVRLARRHNRAQDHGRRRAAGQAGDRQEASVPAHRQLHVARAHSQVKLKGDFRVKGQRQVPRRRRRRNERPAHGRSAQRDRRSDQEQGHREGEVHLRQGRLRHQLLEFKATR